MGPAGRKLARWTGGALLALTLLAGLGVGLALFIIRAPAGQAFLLDRVLPRLEAALDGSLEIAGIRSASLLRGVTLQGIAIRDPEGLPFVTADSLRVGYGFRGLLRGDLELRPVVVWNPTVRLFREGEGEPWNVIRIFRLDGEASPDGPASSEGPDATSSALALVLRDVEVVGGKLRLEQLDGTLQVALDGVDALLSRVAFTGGGQEFERYHISRLAFAGRLAPEAELLRVEDARGWVARGEEGLEFLLERVWLPGSEVGGRGAFRFAGDDGPELELELEGDVVALEDFRWLEPRLPAGTGTLNVSGAGPLASGSWRVEELDLRVAESRVRGRVGVELAGGFRLVDTDLEALPLDLRHLDAWMEELLPLRGTIQGRMRMDGPLDALRLAGNVSFTPEGAPGLRTGIRTVGTLFLGDSPGAGNLEVVLDPLPYRVITVLAPQVEVPGTGTLWVTADGRLRSGLRVDGRLVHGGEGLPETRLDVEGVVRGSVDRPVLDLQTRMEPLALETVGRLLDQDELQGEVDGDLQVRGPLDALELEGSFATPGGVVHASAVLNALDPGERYELSARAEGLELHRMVSTLPEPTRVTGLVRLGGRGLELRTSQGNGVLQLAPSRVGIADVDTLAVHAHLQGGRVSVDTVHLRSNLARLSATGVLPVEEAFGEGAMTVEVEAPDLGVFRPLLTAQEGVAADTLSQLERDILLLEGVDPDALGSAQTLTLEGAARTRFRLHGSLDRLRGDGRATLERGVYGEHGVARATLEFQGDSLLDPRRHVMASLVADSLRTGDLAFQGGEFHLDVAALAGALKLRLQRDDEEEYATQGTFELDSLQAGSVALDGLTLRFDTVTWQLANPAGIAWTSAGVDVDHFRLVRPGPGGMRIEAQGRIPLDGEGDFNLEVEGLSLSRIARILQSDVDLDGSLALDVSLRGMASHPVVMGRMTTTDFRLGDLGFTRVEGGLDYEDLRVSANLSGWRGEQRALNAVASLAADLRLQEVAARFPREEMDIRVALDSLPAGGLLSFLEGLENPEGVLDGEVRLGGRFPSLEPSGTLRLRGGAVSLPTAGIRPSGIQADLTLSPDRRITLDASARSRGTLTARGSVLMDPVDDPTFDLTIAANGFQALDRRDLAGRLGGEMTLRGRFNRPVVGGVVRVEQGVLFLEEFVRSAEVVDLSDPAFFDVVDTSLVNVRSQLAASQNPFLQNLRVDVELLVQRDTWIRSREMNVEIGGDLLVTYSRSDKEVILVGPLQAIRGNYTQFGRQFQVQEGTVEFVGTPGFDPNLSIQAVNRIRRQGGEPLDIVASLDGTLLTPRVTLSSEAQPPIAESDLISYLIFGRPSYALASGETSVLQGAAGAGVALGLGTLASQLGSVVAQQFGVDYFAITQAQGEGPAGVNAGVTSSFADTQIELGQYVLDNVFLAVVLRPLTGLGAGAQNQIPGARLEWRFSDDWTLEGFVEDRFYRQGVSGFGELGVNLSKTLGLSLYRQWAY